MMSRVVAWSLLLASCGGSPAAKPDAPAAASRDAAQPVDTHPAPDPLSARMGSAIANVTLGDGWTDLRALAGAMAITGGWTDSLQALPDGDHLRFAYAPQDFRLLRRQHGHGDRGRSSPARPAARSSYSTRR